MFKILIVNDGLQRKIEVAIDLAKKYDANACYFSGRDSLCSNNRKCMNLERGNGYFWKISDEAETAKRV